MGNNLFTLLDIIPIIIGITLVIVALYILIIGLLTKDKPTKLVSVIILLIVSVALMWFGFKHIPSKLVINNSKPEAAIAAIELLPPDLEEVTQQEDDGVVGEGEGEDEEEEQQLVLITSYEKLRQFCETETFPASQNEGLDDFENEGLGSVEPESFEDQEYVVTSIVLPVREGIFMPRPSDDDDSSESEEVTISETTEVIEESTPAPPPPLPPLDCPGATFLDYDLPPQENGCRLLGCTNGNTYSGIFSSGSWRHCPDRIEVPMYENCVLLKDVSGKTHLMRYLSGSWISTIQCS